MGRRLLAGLDAALPASAGNGGINVEVAAVLTYSARSPFTAITGTSVAAAPQPVTAVAMAATGPITPRQQEGRPPAVSTTPIGGTTANPYSSISAT